MINASTKNWVDKDFLDSFLDLYKRGDSSLSQYVRLQNFIDETNLPLSTSLALSNLKASRETIRDDFRNGEFKFHSLEHAREIATALTDFEQYSKTKWSQAGFAKVFSQMYLNEKYSHSQMIKNLPFKFNLLDLMGTEKATITNLIEIYNYKTPRVKKLYAETILDAWEDMVKSKDLAV